MKKKWQRYAAALLAVFMVLLANCAARPRVRKSGDFEYFRMHGNPPTCSIAGYTGNNSDVVIPETIGRYEVQAINYNAFKDKGLTSVSIPDCVQFIGNSAFANNRLTSITIGSGVRMIGEHAFENNQLADINFLESIAIIHKYAFRYNRLTSVIIPYGVTTIEEGAFANNQLTSVTINDSVKIIGREAFANNRLTSITIPANVKTIGEDAFAGNEINSITFNGSVETIIASGAIAYLAGVYGFYGERPGTYSLRGNDVLYNGHVIKKPAVITTGQNAYLVSINGQSPRLFYYHGNKLYRSNIERNMIGHFPYPENIKEFYTGTFSLPPGQHTIEVIFMKETDIGWEFSTDTRVWEHRYLFEGYTYEINVEELHDNMLLFSINKTD